MNLGPQPWFDKLGGISKMALSSKLFKFNLLFLVQSTFIIKTARRSTVGLLFQTVYYLCVSEVWGIVLESAGY